MNLNFTQHPVYAEYPYLIWILIFFLFLFSGLSIFWYVSRVLRANKEEKRQAQENFFIQLINDLLFEQDAKEIKLEQFSAQQQNSLQYVLIQLHKNYSGDLSKKIEQLFRELGFHKRTIQQLSTSSWYNRQKALRDSGEMKIQEAKPVIIRSIQSKHKELQLEAIVALIRLEGLDALFTIQHIQTNLDNWTLVNITHVLQEFHQVEPEYVTPLLNSENPSVLLLGMRLVGMFRLKGLWEDIRMILPIYLNNRLKKEYEQLHNVFKF